METVVVTGATGFIGKEIVRQLLVQGHSVRALARNPTTSTHPNLTFFTCDVTRQETIKDEMIRGSTVIMHLVGIIAETKKQGFQQAHIDATVNMIEAGKRNSVLKFVHMSALGTRVNARSLYHKTKWAAEEAVRGSDLNWTILRPSIVFGPGDPFTSMFVKMMQFPLYQLQLGCIPLPGGGENLLQPIAVKDVASCFITAATNPLAVCKHYDLAGPEKLSLKETVKVIARAKKKSPLLIHAPLALVRLGATVFEWVLPKPPVTRDQLLMLEEDNISSDYTQAEKDLCPHTFLGFREGVTRFIH